MVQMLQAIALNMDAADLANGSGAGNAADDSSSGSFEDDEGTRDDSPLPESSSSPTGVVARGDAMPRSPLSPVHRDHHDDGYTGSFEIEEDSLEARVSAGHGEREMCVLEMRCLKRGKGVLRQRERIKDGRPLPELHTSWRSTYVWKKKRKCTMIPISPS